MYGIRLHVRVLLYAFYGYSVTNALLVLWHALYHAKRKTAGSCIIGHALSNHGHLISFNIDIRDFTGKNHVLLRGDLFEVI